MSVFLFVALALDRAEFLEYLHELGINIYSKLTIQMLWTLYYEVNHNYFFHQSISAYSWHHHIAGKINLEKPFVVVFFL